MAVPKVVLAASKVEIIYLVPTDREERPAYSAAIEGGVAHFRNWLEERVGSTFDMTSTAVTVIGGLSRASAYRTQRPASPNSFFANVWTELDARRLIPGKSEQRSLLVFVDADHACGQSGAAVEGVAILSANDLRGLTAEPIAPACDQPNAAEIPGRMRWIGGLGHELLHTFGLGHADRLTSCRDSACRAAALMMHGYVRYPEAQLLPEEKDHLRQRFR